MTGEDIKRMRTEMGLEQSVMAHIIECRQHHISRWESGKHIPSKKNQYRIQHLYDHYDTELYEQRIAEAILACM